MVTELSLRTSTEIQGNILAGFNKDHATFLFLKFPNQARARAWLTDMLPHIAATRDVAAFNERFSAARHARGGDDPENMRALWVNLSLTHHGLTTVSHNLHTDLQPFTEFREGPAQHANQLNDKGAGAPTTWVVGGPGQDVVDAVVVVAADDPDDLRVELEKERARASKHGLTVIFEQRGDTLPGHRAGHEHFGFKDGISQPGVLGFDAQDPRSGTGHPDHPDPQVLGHLGSDIIAPGEFLLGYPRQPDSAKNTTARPAPAWMKDGSFQVFRRLAQDVPGFWAQVTTRVHSLPSDDPMTEDELGAKLVGRWRSGTPLDLAPEADNRSTRDPADDNNFEFENDLLGHRCPRFAHIRKVYPRDDETFGDERRRIIRRGIPFGLQFDPAAGRGHGADAKRGLLFVAYMSSIGEQFEFLQQTWANNAGFPEGQTGPDPVIGDTNRPSPNLLRRADRPDAALEFGRFVTTEGAVYSFAPSASTLAKLASGQL